MISLRYKQIPDLDKDLSGQEIILPSRLPELFTLKSIPMFLSTKITNKSELVLVDKIDNAAAISMMEVKKIRGLQQCVGLYSAKDHFSPNEVDRLDTLYKTLGQQFKWSSAVKRIPLDFLQGDRFREAAGINIRPLLTKGVPSLFSDLSSL